MYFTGFVCFARTDSSLKGDNTVAHAKPLFSPDLIDDALNVPLYQQIFSLLRVKIMRGEIPRDTLLPPEMVMTEMFGVSRITIKRAMSELAVAGLVRRQRGVGTLVTHDATKPAMKGSFEFWNDGLKQADLQTDVQLIDNARISAGAALAASLGITADADVQRIVRVRRISGDPFSRVLTFIPIDVYDRITASDLDRERLTVLLERSGQFPAEAEATFVAEAADVALASLLAVTAGSPLLRINYLLRDSSGRPMQDITTHYRSDRFQFQMQLTRGASRQNGWKAES